MFSLQLPKFFTSRFLRPLALLAIAAFAAPGTALANSPWSTVGSTGIVDESCYLAVQMENFEARLVPGLLFPCKVRYQVTDTFGTANGIVTNRALFAHIRDTAATPGKVVVRMFAYNLITGATTPIAGTNIDSDVTPSSGILANGFSVYRSPAAAVGCGVTLNFNLNSYWIEVDLTPALQPAVPGLAIGALSLRTC